MLEVGLKIYCPYVKHWIGYELVSFPASSGWPRAVVWAPRGLALQQQPVQLAPATAVKAQLLASCEADGQHLGSQCSFVDLSTTCTFLYPFPPLPEEWLCCEECFALQDICPWTDIFSNEMEEISRPFGSVQTQPYRLSSFSMMRL